jgi:hypothetical protein
MESLLHELNRVFLFLNTRLFADLLEPPPIVVDPQKKFTLKYVNGYLMIGSHFKNVEPHDLLLHLLHEMVHMRNEKKEVVDVTANQYHNRKFLAAALSVGLVVRKHKIQGWGLTGANIPKGSVVDPEMTQVPSQQAVQRRIAAFQEVKLDMNALNNVKEEIKKKLARKSPAKPCFLKYVCECPPPHNSIRSGRRPDGDHPLLITCDKCGAKFVCVTIT